MKGRSRPLRLTPSTGTAVFQGLLPLTEVVAAHVRTEEHRAEIASRDYRNIDPAWIPLRVTPALFEGDRPDLEPNLAWLRALPAARALDVGQLETRESLAGALIVLLDGLPAREPLLTQAAALASRQLSWAGVEATDEAFISAIQDVGWVTESHDLADLQAVLSHSACSGGP